MSKTEIIFLCVITLGVLGCAGVYALVMLCRAAYLAYRRFDRSRAQKRAALADFREALEQTQPGQGGSAPPHPPEPGARAGLGDYVCKVGLCDQPRGHEGLCDDAPNPPPSSGMRVVALPSPGTIGGRPIKQPIFCRRVVQAGVSCVRFFDGDPSVSWQDTNLPGSQGGMPANHHFYLYGVSLVPDARAGREEVKQIWDTGVLELRLTQTTLHRIPAREVMSDQPYFFDEEHDDSGFTEARTGDGSKLRFLRCKPTPRVAFLRSEGPVRDLTIASKPVELSSFQDFRWQLELGEPLRRDAGVMVVMYGVLIRGICG